MIHMSEYTDLLYLALNYGSPSTKHLFYNHSTPRIRSSKSLYFGLTGKIRNYFLVQTSSKMAFFVDSSVFC